MCKDPRRPTRNVQRPALPVILARSARECLQVFSLLSLPGFGLPVVRFASGNGMQGLAWKVYRDPPRPKILVWPAAFRTPFFGIFFSSKIELSRKTSLKSGFQGGVKNRTKFNALLKNLTFSAQKLASRERSYFL